jgi:hypothetical protein
MTRGKADYATRGIGGDKFDPGKRGGDLGSRQHASQQSENNRQLDKKHQQQAVQHRNATSPQPAVPFSRPSTSSGRCRA